MSSEKKHQFFRWKLSVLGRKTYGKPWKQIPDLILTSVLLKGHPLSFNSPRRVGNLVSRWLDGATRHWEGSGFSMIWVYLEDGIPGLVSSHEKAIGKGNHPILRGLTITMVINHLLTGMILQLTILMQRFPSWEARKMSSLNQTGLPAYERVNLQCVKFCLWYVFCFDKIWGFPKMVVPPKHPKMITFSRKTHGCRVPPFQETPTYTKEFSNAGLHTAFYGKRLHPFQITCCQMNDGWNYGQERC